MTRMKTALTVALALGTIGLGAQPPAVTVDGDDITIRGCVTEAGTSSAAAPSVLVWSRSDIMLAAAETLGEHAAVTGRVFYWLDDEEDLSSRLGKRVEITGDLEDLEKGELEIEQDGDGYTKVKLELDGKSEEARVPTSWLGMSPRGDSDEDIDIAARKIDVDDIKVLGDCR